MAHSGETFSTPGRCRLSDGPSASPVLPTPCRARAQLELSGARKQLQLSPGFGTPVDPFVASKALQHTPPQSQKTRTKRTSIVGLRTFAEVAVQTDCESVESAGEECLRGTRRPSCIRKTRACAGTLLWWIIRVTVVNALLLPWLSTTRDKVLDRAEFGSDLSYSSLATQDQASEVAVLGALTEEPLSSAAAQAVPEHTALHLLTATTLETTGPVQPDVASTPPVSVAEEVGPPMVRYTVGGLLGLISTWITTGLLADAFMG